MGYGFNRQEEKRVAGRLAHLNARRTLLVSVVSMIATIVLALIYNIPGVVTGSTSLANVALLGLFIISAAAMFLEKRAIEKHKTMDMSIIAKFYWALFEGLMIILIYADAQGGGHMGLYPILLGAICFGPVFTTTERIYYLSLQGVFIIFANINYGASVSDFVYLAALNGLFIAAGTGMANKAVGELVAAERAKDAKDLDAIDKLTGLLNRKGFDKRTGVASDSCTRTHKKMSVLMFDIDDLQQFNNSFGSDRGNFLIRQIGQIIQESCKRDSDIVCRQNGGRFLVYIDGRDETYVSELADRTRAAVEGKRINHGRRASRPYVTLSVGIATGVPVEPSDIDVLCDEAENYLFGAKKLGKNCVVCDELLFGAYNRSMPRRGMYDEEINAV
ncbi:MAG: GGDEF domain-containing protein [Lachnospiraceae bacterium]|nr:GGDEF domain-containing protein [Lachnospiraceae bacterium]